MYFSFYERLGCENLVGTLNPGSLSSRVVIVIKLEANFKFSLWSRLLGAFVIGLLGEVAGSEWRGGANHGRIGVSVLLLLVWDARPRVWAPRGT